jgi:RNA polymerase sigma-70 factor (ECF subfamily)
MESYVCSRIRRFYEANRQGLYSYALSLSGDRAEAEDAVQSAISRLLSRGRLPEDLRPYAYRCVRNAVVDGFRERNAHREPLLDAEAVAAPSTDPNQLRLLEQCLNRLSDDERETVVLKGLEGLTFREIAAIRRRTVNTVASWYRCGLAKMQTMLGESQ